MNRHQAGRLANAIEEVVFYAGTATSRISKDNIANLIVEITASAGPEAPKPAGEPPEWALREVGKMMGRLVSHPSYEPSTVDLQIARLLAKTRDDAINEAYFAASGAIALPDVRQDVVDAILALVGTPPRG